MKKMEYRFTMQPLVILSLGCIKIATEHFGCCLLIVVKTSFAFDLKHVNLADRT